MNDSCCWMTVLDAAGAVGCCRRSIYNKVKSGELPYRVVAGLFSASVIEVDVNVLRLIVDARSCTREAKRTTKERLAVARRIIRAAGEEA